MPNTLRKSAFLLRGSNFVPFYLIKRKVVCTGIEKILPTSLDVIAHGSFIIAG
jgi:hypothetical protein